MEQHIATIQKNGLDTIEVAFKEYKNAVLDLVRFQCNTALRRKLLVFPVELRVGADIAALEKAEAAAPA